MKFFTNFLASLLHVKGKVQGFIFDKTLNKATFRLKSLFKFPTPTKPSILEFDMLNSESKGYRTSVLTNSGDEKPSYYLGSVAPYPYDENARLISDPILTFNEAQTNEFRFYNPVNVPAPIQPSQAVNLGSLSPYIKSDALPDILSPYATKAYVDSVATKIETGTFTPYVRLGSPTSTSRQYSGTGSYIKIGRTVSILIEFRNFYPLYSTSEFLFLSPLIFNPSNNDTTMPILSKNFGNEGQKFCGWFSPIDYAISSYEINDYGQISGWGYTQARNLTPYTYLYINGSYLTD